MDRQADIGLVGLGTMGAALSLNIAEKGFDIAVWNRKSDRPHEFRKQAGELGARIHPADTLEDLVASLSTPRAIILMIPSGDPVDDMIAKLRPLLDADDLIIDAGNANFHDTIRRTADSGGPFLGMGVSGGEEGARHGPSIMGGGKREHWDRVAPILEAISAKYEGAPCAAWMGESGAGHFVKTVHNGIEYADMQMIAETYGILRDGHGMSAPDIAPVFAGWNEGVLQSYLVEISAKVAAATDAATGGPLLEVIVDAAGQKGTGRWTVIEAQHLAAPVPAIEAAVVARNLSARREERATGESLFGAAPKPLPEGALEPALLEEALICGKIMCYAQGFTMIAAAARQFGWTLDLPAIARVWREGCIIRSAMLNDMADALAEDPDRNLLFAPFFAAHVKRTQHALREVVSMATAHGLAVPALSSGLAYFDQMRTARGTANMIQGQRDFFGLHGFARLDDGTTGQHGPWADAAANPDDTSGKQG
ncbi:NADP-dependent phosphogluconate dehydrogenase [Pseudoroseicyclus tamaricis]|uniref:6-phosphogluconate dehydrogenase, decarboxylating n=1 Tax=Pseudoroseicyclus tamaricis TaxID=2705421 RepID=A0A6B2JLF4_9RHOB|nr:NADP-dependent phosphogluconate dehydrogenase [Pseudoroseicyclus tamaricis]NDV02383.1 NADP-dependent phosphogluconate dehydrogenase [Pseudoroseicyclus tamaricis]